jgi:hypothetical protein
MRLRLLERVWRSLRGRPARPDQSAARRAAGRDPVAGPAGPGRSAGPASRPAAGTGRTPGAGSHRKGNAPRLVLREPGRHDAQAAARTASAPGRAAVRVAPDAATARRSARADAGRPAAVRPDAAGASPGAAATRPWYEIAHSNRTAAGRRHCGTLEEVIRREWSAEAVPPPESVLAIDRLADLPQLIKKKLAAGLDAIHVGPGGVPDLDDMGRLSGVPLPSGRATWDACAGAYGERKIIVGSRPSPSPDVMCHEIGHALDDIDGASGQWQSDSEEFRALYDRCFPHMLSDFHRQRGTLGRREFFADAFAAIASRQRPALVDMVGGDTRAALDVMLYFNVRYGI